MYYDTHARLNAFLYHIFLLSAINLAPELTVCHSAITFMIFYNYIFLQLIIYITLSHYILLFIILFIHYIPILLYWYPL